MFRIVAICSLTLIISFNSPGYAQAISQEKSAKAAAMNDTRFIALNIEDNEGAMFLSRKAVERGSDERLKDLAQQMIADHTTILYEFEQLNVAGGGSASQNTSTSESANNIAEMYAKLSRASGVAFDTLWVSSVLAMQQDKFVELTAAKEAVMNPQLKMVITRALPLVRKNVNQLKAVQKHLAKMVLQRKKEAERKAKQAAG
jgi:predicted outer membrane protein